MCSHREFVSGQSIMCMDCFKLWWAGLLDRYDDSRPETSDVSELPTDEEVNAVK